MAYSDNPIEWNTELLDEMQQLYRDHISGGAALSIHKDTYSVKYHSLPELREEISKLQKQITMSEVGCYRGEFCGY